MKRKKLTYDEFIRDIINMELMLKHHTKKHKIQLVCYLDLMYGFRINY